ncbi:THO complex subunit 6 [Bacillus rossius redtenbacheri]|uniref:THO complex subunit 6 n=1 Tax=Bacillus rossius redtenbacheri TaxID=93214 RepID=UPI002FDDDF1F
MVEKLLYNTVLAQTFSACGNYLIASNTYGEIATFDLQKMVSPGEGLGPPCREAEYHFSPRGDAEVCSLATTDRFLVAGLAGEITGWDWKTVTSGTSPKQSWSIQIATAKDAVDKPDVNCMAYSRDDNLLYAGCGDSKIHVFSLEDGRLVRTLSGHEDYVHCVDKFRGQLASAGEDGCVKLWDTRQKECVASLQPHLKEKVARPELGKWVGAVALSEDWMVCGGGPRLSLWHLRSMDVMTAFPLDDAGVHVAAFQDDRILVGGTMPHFYHLNYSGAVYAQVPSSSTTVYSVVYQESPVKVMCLAGSSSKIDVCTNFTYRDQIISFAPKIKSSFPANY